jgi:hypothetical protein
MSDMLGLILFMCFVGFLAVGIVFIFIRVLEAMQRNDK